MKFRLLESFEDNLTKITSTLISQHSEMKHLRVGENIEGYAYFDSDKLIGFVSVETKPDGEKWIQGLEVLKEYQGKGYGKKLLSFACNTLGVTRLSVKKTNKRAIDLYTKFGFKVFDKTDYMYFMELKKNEI